MYQISTIIYNDACKKHRNIHIPCDFSYSNTRSSSQRQGRHSLRQSSVSVYPAENLSVCVSASYTAVYHATNEVLGANSFVSIISRRHLVELSTVLFVVYLFECRCCQAAYKTLLT